MKNNNNYSQRRPYHKNYPPQRKYDPNEPLPTGPRSSISSVQPAPQKNKINNFKMIIGQNKDRHRKKEHKRENFMEFHESKYEDTYEIDEKNTLEYLNTGVENGKLLPSVMLSRWYSNKSLNEIFNNEVFTKHLLENREDSVRCLKFLSGVTQPVNLTSIFQDIYNRAIMQPIAFIDWNDEEQNTDILFKTAAFMLEIKEDMLKKDESEEEEEEL